MALLYIYDSRHAMGGYGPPKREECNGSIDDKLFAAISPSLDDLSTNLSTGTGFIMAEATRISNGLVP